MYPSLLLYLSLFVLLALFVCVVVCFFYVYLFVVWKAHWISVSKKCYIDKVLLNLLTYPVCFHRVNDIP